MGWNQIKNTFLDYPIFIGRNREAEELMLRMANTNKVPDINLEIHRTSRSNSGENEGIKCNSRSPQFFFQDLFTKSPTEKTKTKYILCMKNGTLRSQWF